MLRRALPRLGDLLFVALFAGCLIIGQRMLNTDSDLGRHLTLGNYILDTRTVPVRDVLSFTRAGYSRPPYEWLAQVAFATSDRLLGLGGVVLLTAVTIACSYLVVFVDAVDRTQSPVLCLLIVGWAAVASSLHWLTRPHVFTFLFLALWIAGLERLRSGRRMPLWPFPVLMLVWANTHGGFVFGFLAWAAYIAGWLIAVARHSPAASDGWRLVLVGAVSAVASVITPDFWHNWQAVLQNRSAYVLGRTAETMMPSLSFPATWPFLGLVAVCVIGLVLDLRRVAAAHVLLLCGFAVLAFAAARNIALFAVAAAPIAAAWSAEAAPPGLGRRRFEASVWRIDRNLKGHIWPAVSVIAVVAVFAIQSPAFGSKIYSFRPGTFPVKAASWEQAHPLTGRMFNDLNWGGYLLYRLWPGHRVFIDSQSDFYGEGLIRQYETLILAEPGWQAILDQFHIDWVIISPRSKLAEQLNSSTSWRPLYGDSTASIFARVGMP